MEWIVLFLIIGMIAWLFEVRKQKKLIKTYFDTRYAGGFQDILEFINNRVSSKIKSKTDLEDLKKRIFKLCDKGYIVEITDECWIRSDAIQEINTHLQNNYIISINDSSSNILTNGFNFSLSSEVMRGLTKRNLVVPIADGVWRSTLATNNDLVQETIILD